MKHRPYQLPVQIGSLVTSSGERFPGLMRGDKVAGGNLASSSCVQRGCPKGIYKRETPGQPKRQGKGADRRSTNHAGVVKVTRIESWMSGDCEWRPVVLSGKPDTPGVEMGECTRGAHRRKSGRYAAKRHFLRNWGGLDMSGDGKSGYKAVCPSKSCLKHIKESEMAIVPDVSGDSKTSEREGPLVFSVYVGGRGA